MAFAIFLILFVSVLFLIGFIVDRERCKAEEKLGERKRKRALSTNRIYYQTLVDKSYNLALKDIDRDGREEAFGMMEKAISINPNCSYAYIYYARILSFENISFSQRVYSADCKKALELIQKAYELDPENGNVFVVWGIVLLSLKNNTESEIKAEKLSKEAECKFGKAIELDPSLSEAHFYIGMIYDDNFYTTGSEYAMHKSIEYYQRAVELSPHDSHYQNCLLNVLQRALNKTGIDSLKRQYLFEQFQNLAEKVVNMSGEYDLEEWSNSLYTYARTMKDINAYVQAVEKLEMAISRLTEDDYKDYDPASEMKFQIILCTIQMARLDNTLSDKVSDIQKRLSELSPFLLYKASYYNSLLKALLADDDALFDKLKGEIEYQTDMYRNESDTEIITLKI